MKKCPRCNLSYSDDSLEFCLEDGTKLISTTYQTETPTITRQNKSDLITEPTLGVTPSDLSKPGENNQIRHPERFQESLPAKAAPEKLKEKVTDQSLKVLEISPLIIALAHNWWQWLYLNNQYYSTFWTYVLSANFLMWLLLLVLGATTSLAAVRYGRNRSFSYASLVVLAVNLLLFLAPKR